MAHQHEIAHTDCGDYVVEFCRSRCPEKYLKRLYNAEAEYWQEVLNRP